MIYQPKPDKNFSLPARTTKHSGIRVLNEGGHPIDIDKLASAIVILACEKNLLNREAGLAGAAGAPSADPTPSPPTA